MALGWGVQRWGLDRWGSNVLPTGPFVRNVSPTVLTTISDIQQIYFEVAGVSLPLTILIVAEFPNVAISELVYSSSGLSPYYSTSTVGVLSDGLSFRLLRLPRWPGSSVALRVFAIDSNGRNIAQTLLWDVQQTSTTTVQTSTVREVARQNHPLGFGLVRPFHRIATDDFATAADAALVRSSVGQILGTGLGEIPWRPQFGTSLSRLRHMRNVSALPELARISIEEALRRWEPRVQVIELSSEPITAGNENKVLLSLSYRINTGPADIIKLVL